MSKLKNFLRRMATRWDLVEPMVWMRHRPWYLLNVEVAMVKCRGAALDDATIRRVPSAYRASRPDRHYGTASMWRDFFETRQRRLHDLFLTGTAGEVRKALSNPGESDLSYGFDSFFPEFVRQLKRSASDRESYAQLCLDDLLRSAEAFGLTHCDWPESGAWRNNAVSAEEIRVKIEKPFGINITFPNPYPDEFGLATSRGVASYRAVYSLDLALRVKQLLSAVPAPKILEIGAGLGRAAYYAMRIGLPHYEVVDLPFTAISQGYFLMSTLGTDKVVLAGEAGSGQRGTVRLTTPSDFLAAATRYDLVVNVDSFTEIDPEVARRYWNKIPTGCGEAMWKN